MVHATSLMYIVNSCCLCINRLMAIHSALWIAEVPTCCSKSLCRNCHLGPQAKHPFKTKKVCLTLQVFENGDAPPDAEFGCFQIVYGPPDSEYAEEALLRLDVGEHFVFY